MAGRNDYFMRGVSRGKTSKADMGGGFLRRATRSGKSLYFVWLEEGSHGGVAGSSEIKFCSVWPAGRTSGFLNGLFNDTLPGAGFVALSELRFMNPRRIILHHLSQIVGWEVCDIDDYQNLKDYATHN